MIPFTCLATAATLSCIYFNEFEIDKSLGDFERGLFAISAIIMFGLVILLVIEINKPTAMDVYRGKTTLEITYKDNVAIDSVVVFKKELK